MIFCFDEYELDLERQELRRGSQLIKVDPLGLRMLAALVRNAGRLLSKDELAAEVWNSRLVPANVITVTMARLRKALGSPLRGPHLVSTVYGRGYRFEREVVVREAGRPASDAKSEPHPSGPPMVGRAQVLERVSELLRDTSSALGRACFLLGEPGMGKTRIAAEFVQDHLTNDARSAWGHCRGIGATPPLHPWLRILRTVLASNASHHWLAELGPEAHALLRLLDSTSPQGRPGMALTLDGAVRTRAVETIIGALRVASQRTPWVIVLDDMHHADALSLELTTRLLDALSEMRILLLATVRIPLHASLGDHQPSLQNVLSRPDAERITLEPLHARDVLAYTSAVVDDRTGRWARAIYIKSEGNPFLMTEFVKQIKGGAIVSPDALALPPPALDIIRQPLAKLSPETVGLLGIAAVLGRKFDLWLLQAVSEKLMAPFMACLDEAVAARLLVLEPDQTGFSFQQEFVRMVLYDDLSRMERRRYHRRAAEALEERRGEVKSAIAPSTVAHHFHAAMPEIDLQKTVRYCRHAARLAATLHAHDDAARYLGYALDAIGLMERPDPRLRARLLLRVALHRRARADVFIPTITEVIRLARRQADGCTMALAGALAAAHPELYQVTGAAEVLREALSLLPGRRTLLRAIALASLACLAPQAYCRERARVLIDEADALSEAGRSPLASSATLLPKLYLRGGFPPGDSRPEAIKALEHRACTEPGHASTTPLYLSYYRAVHGLQRGDIPAVRAATACFGEVARRLDRPEMLWHWRRIEALVALQTGNRIDPARQLTALHQHADRDAIVGADPFCAFDRVVWGSELDEEALVLDDITRRSLRHVSSDPPSTWALKIRALQAGGLHDEARASLEMVSPTALARLPCDIHYLGTLGHLAVASVALGMLEYAGALEQLLSPHLGAFAGNVSFFCEGTVAQLMGMLAIALGRPRDATLLLERGIARADRAGLVLAAADARLLLAGCLQHAALDDARARSLAREAQALCQRNAIQGRLARTASALLRRDAQPLPPPFNPAAARPPAASPSPASRRDDRDCSH